MAAKRPTSNSDNQMNTYKFSLSETTYTIYRDYNKFTVFLAGTNSIISSCFAVFTLLSKFVNSKLLESSLANKVTYSKDMKLLKDCHDEIIVSGQLKVSLYLFRRKFMYRLDWIVLEIWQMKTLRRLN